jgi:hypothetical protein
MIGLNEAIDKFDDPDPTVFVAAFACKILTNSYALLNVLVHLLSRLAFRLFTVINYIFY